MISTQQESPVPMTAEEMGAVLAAGAQDRKAALMLTGDRRDEVARILEIVAKDGLDQPRDLDAALDAIEQAYLHTDNT